MATCRSLLSSLVAVLLQHRCPHAIILAVVAVVVFTLNTVALAWPLPHVLIEAGEIRPLLADFNSTSAPVSVLFVPWVATPSSHVHPDGILRHSPEAVSSGYVASAFISALPAPLRPARRDSTLFAGPLDPTVTLANKSCVPVFRFLTATDDSKPANMPADKAFCVNLSFHSTNIAQVESEG